MAATSVMGPFEPWTYRLPAALFSVLSSGLLFIMVTRKFSWPVGFTAAAFYSFCPFTWLFGNMPDVVGSQLVFFGLATIEGYSRWRDTGKSTWLWVAAASWLLCALTDWPAFFIPPMLAAHFVLMSPWRQWWKVVPFGAATALVLGFLFWWLMAHGDTDLTGQLLHRTAGKSDGGTSVGIADWWRVGVCYYLATTFTLPLLILATFYVVRLLFTWRFPWKTPATHDTTVILLLWGLLHVGVGMQSSHQHMWVWTVLLPGVCAAAALGVVAIGRCIPARFRHSPFTVTVLIMASAWFLFSSALTAQSISTKGLPDRDLITYTLQDLGTMIRTFVPAGQGVLTSDLGEARCGTSEPALWFYADRQIKNGIRSAPALESAMRTGDYTLPYNYKQSGGAAPLWFVLPTQHHEQYPELAAELDAKYPRWFKDGFLLYYLGPDGQRVPSS